MIVDFKYRDYLAKVLASIRKAGVEMASHNLHLGFNDVR